MANLRRSVRQFGRKVKREVEPYAKGAENVVGNLTGRGEIGKIRGDIEDTLRKVQR
jgi:hypothetical protein